MFLIALLIISFIVSLLTGNWWIFLVGVLTYLLIRLVIWMYRNGSDGDGLFVNDGSWLDFSDSGGADSDSSWGGGDSGGAGSSGDW